MGTVKRKDIDVTPTEVRACHTRVWLLKLPDALSGDDVPMLSPDERARMTRYRHERDAMRFGATHIAARHLIADFIDCDAWKVVIGSGNCPKCGTSDHGPPRIVAPEPDLRLSLSRSGNCALVALTKESAIGVDIESNQQNFDPSVGRLCLSSSEYRYVLGLVHHERREAFCRSWVRKEAVAKACGTGILMDLRDLEVHPELLSPCRVVRQTDGVSGEWLVHDLRLGYGLFGALALPAESKEAEVPDLAPGLDRTHARVL